MSNDAIETILKEILGNQNDLQCKIEGLIVEQKYIKENLIDVKSQTVDRCNRHDLEIQKNISSSILSLEFNFEKRISRLMWWFISSVCVSMLFIFIDGYVK